MADPIPYEDNITHTQLWKRIDDARDSLNSTVQQADDHWKESVAAIISNIQSLLEDNKKFMDQKQADLQGMARHDAEKLQAIMDDALAAFGRKLDEYMGKVEVRFNNLQMTMAKKFDDANANFVSDSKVAGADLKKEVELSVNNSITQAIHKMTDNRREVDVRLNNMESLIEKSAQLEVDKYFRDISSKVDGMVVAEAEFKKQVSDDITKFQSDTGQKFGTVDSKLETVLGKLRGILKEL